MVFIHRQKNGQMMVSLFNSYKFSNKINILLSFLVFQRYIKHTLEYLKVQARETKMKIEMALDEAKRGCVCALNEANDIEEFNLPLKNFEDIKELDGLLEDVSRKQKLVFNPIFIKCSIMRFNRCSYLRNVC